VRVLVTILLLLSTLASASWEPFRDRFVAPEGRVLDDSQGSITHSEGQGAVMLLAVAHNDRPTFDRLWQWTQKHLQVRGDDRLLAWNWHPDRGVTDRNNASDADLLAAWALARAADRWKEPEYRRHARELAADIRRRLLRPSAFGPVLLPGAQGFENEGATVVNLSYWVFPALRAMRELDPDDAWPALEASGLALLEAARFGRWQLPADWIELKGSKVAPAPKFPARFGYDAIRIPLHLRWAGLDGSGRLERYRSYWAHFDGARFLPAWTTFADDSVDSFGAAPGFRALADFVRAPRARGHRAAPPDIASGYYSALLAMLVALAAAEAPGR
jgi:endoglucanase